MPDETKKSGSPHLLLTNDDGIHAGGISALERAVAGLGTVTVLAPCDHLSGCSHKVITDRPMQLNELGQRRYSIDGNPADCARVGLLHLAPETDWVLSGVNEGGNLGVDVIMSGTVAAVREAVWLGKRGIAFSQYRKARRPVDWGRVVPLVQHVLEVLWPKPLPNGCFWNVNFPDPDTFSAPVPEVVFCHLEPGHIPVQFEYLEGKLHYRSRYQDRPRQPGTDVDVCFSGRISVTLLRAIDCGEVC